MLLHEQIPLLGVLVSLSLAELANRLFQILHYLNFGVANEVVFRLDIVIFALDFESLLELLLPLESTLDLGFVEQRERSSLLRLLSD